MEVFNKFYSQVTNSVSSTVSQLSGVLPGNPVTREFETTSHIASAGSGLLWKIYSGYKRSTKQDASVFVFEKRQLEKWNKNDREFILESLRRGIQQLTKIRHPQVLTIQHPLEESRESLAFAAEPVFASLANVLGETTNMPQPGNMSDYKFFDIEIKYGMLQISEGLAFLHNDVKLLHKNLCPETIIINSSGVWKIFGLDFCVHNKNPPNVEAHYPFQDYSPTLPIVCQPNLNYLAPECIVAQSHSPASDMFSLGMLAYAIYSTEKQCIFPVRDIPQFKSRVQQLKNLSLNKLQCIPSDLREYIKLLLSPAPDIRPDAHQFIKISFFHDVGIKTLTYLDSLLQWDNIQKSQFYKGLPEALQKLPHRVKLKRVLSCLVRDLGQPIMVPFILPSVFEIAKDCNKEEYCTYVLPHLKPLMKLTDPVQVLLIMLQRMELLLKLTPAEDIQLHVLPMLYRGLDSDSPQIHELCLSVLPTFAGLLDHSNVKNSLLPRIKRLCLSTSTLSVRVNCLLCIGKLLEHLDKWLVLDEVLPFLPQIPSREPAVLMGILGIYKIAMTHKKLGITKEIIASRVLPFLIPLCIENGLTLSQFNALTSLVKEMFQIVETEHRTKLEQLNSVRDEEKELASNMTDITNPSKPNELNKSVPGLDGFMSLNLKDKPIINPTINNQNIATGQIISKNEPKDLSKSLLDDWVDSVSGNQFKSPQSTFGNENFMSSETKPQQKDIKSNWNSEIRSSSTIAHNTWSNSMSNFNLTSPNNNFNPMMAMSNQHNPWSSNQQHNTFNHSGNSSSGQNNWSALDNLLPTSSNASKLPMNQMMQNKRPSPNNHNNITNRAANQLSKDEIMDLLS